MSLAKTRKLMYETFVALSEGKVSIDHVFAASKATMAIVAVAEREEERLKMAITLGAISYEDAVDSIAYEAEDDLLYLSEPQVGIPT